ncbi:hypothetical protein H6F76_02650 [Leptolyngbya sp. FACHB-321]|uniref:hypothetical protein n=1 Tax=Leptolyngbya sp. FACHB-321 TaxID=2692807 RepID=UPI001683F6D4|nr:hypothetical protein [Leptolyngbya sp. FACHB-321]MBD2033949.1 hypothetical protein [Leptolyngbya sp. FACHB-321]
MATLIPAFSTCTQRMAPEERRLAQRLEDKLEADYLLWYDVLIATKRLHPYFILLHPLNQHECFKTWDDLSYNHFKAR